MGIRIKKNDTVEVISGKERGKRGHVLRVLSSGEHAHVLIEKLNMIKRHTKATQKNPHGGITEKESPIHISNVLVYCNKCNKPVRAGRKFLSSDTSKKKIRFCKRCGEVIDKI